MFVKIGDFIKFKGCLVELLENKRSSENQRPPENHHKSGLLRALPFTMHLFCTSLILAKQTPEFLDKIKAGEFTLALGCAPITFVI